MTPSMNYYIISYILSIVYTVSGNLQRAMQQCSVVSYSYSYRRYSTILFGHKGYALSSINTLLNSRLYLTVSCHGLITDPCIVDFLVPTVGSILMVCLTLV